MRELSGVRAAACHLASPAHAGCGVLSPAAPRRRQRAGTLSTALNFLADQVILFRWGELVFVTFGLFASVGAFLSLAGMGAILIGQGVRPEIFLTIALLGSVAVVVGSWVAGQAFDYRLLLQNPRQALRRPVFVSWGGVLAVIIVMGLMAPFSGVSVLLLLDAAARALPIGHALGRLGCMSYGCCFGRPTSGPLAVTYRHRDAKAVRVAGLQHVPLHPAAFYEAVLDLGILIAVNAASLFGAPIGIPTALALMLYGLGRFAIEFTRNNDGRMVVGLLSINHLISLALVALGGMALPALLLGSDAAPAFSWMTAVAGLPRLMPAIFPGALVVFLGFSLHRGRVGEW